ncbi:MAG: hypothetical protein LUE87_11605 [Lachnospiraceae bacterium]|nr:hypothetical protein [Lachnospiraceae bacterium]
MTDWGGYGDRGRDGLIRAGVNWIAPGSDDDTMVTPLVEALENGKLSRGVLQRSVADLIRVVVRFH